METTDRHAGRGGRSAITDDDNVVRLPREWLGPPDQLVPLADDDPVPALATPGSTHDFWGEGLGQDFGVRVESDAVASRARVRRGAGLRWRWPVFARGGADARSIRRLPAAAALGAAALVIVALAIGGAGAPSAPRRSAAATSVRHVAASSGAVAFVAHGTLTSSPAIHGAARHRATSRHHAAVPRRATHRVLPARAAVAEPVHYTPAAPTTSVYPSSSTPPAGVSAPSSGAAATGASAGSHQPATGATGALGPGSSPDG